MDYTSMATSMVSNLKKIHEETSRSDIVESMMYRQLIGSLMYLVHTKPEICFIVSALSQFMFELRHIHWVAMKHVLIYLCGTVGYGIKYSSGGGVMLLGYTGSNWVGSVVERKSTSSVLFQHGFIRDFLVQPKVEYSGIEYHRGRVYSSL